MQACSWTRKSKLVGCSFSLDLVTDIDWFVSAIYRTDVSGGRTIRNLYNGIVELQVGFIFLCSLARNPKVSYFTFNELKEINF